jgi:hypothetical protein
MKPWVWVIIISGAVVIWIIIIYTAYLLYDLFGQ